MSELPTGNGWTPDGEKLNGDLVRIQVLGKHEMLAGLEGAAKINPLFNVSDQWLKQKTETYPDDVRVVWAFVISSSDRCVHQIAMLGRMNGTTRGSVLWPAADVSWRDPAFKRGFARLFRRMIQALAENLGRPLPLEELDHAEKWGEDLVRDFPKPLPEPLRAGPYKINADGSTGVGPSKWS